MTRTRSYLEVVHKLPPVANYSHNLPRFPFPPGSPSRSTTGRESITEIRKRRRDAGDVSGVRLAPRRTATFGIAANRIRRSF